MSHFSPTEIPDVLSITPRVFEDHRGFFMETYQKQVFLADFARICSGQSFLIGSMDTQRASLPGHSYPGKAGALVLARFLMSLSTCEKALHTLANGLAQFFLTKTRLSCGSHPALPMDSWSSLNMQMSFTKPQTFTIVKAIEQFTGMIQI